MGEKNRVQQGGWDLPASGRIQNYRWLADAELNTNPAPQGTLADREVLTEEEENESNRRFTNKRHISQIKQEIRFSDMSKELK